MSYNLNPPGLRERLFQVRREDRGDRTALNRCLGLFPLIIQGLAHMLGAGIFVVTPEIVQTTAGPATFLSYLLAGFAAGLSVICYSDLASRYSCAGSAYAYTYYAIGEFAAAIVGFFLIGEMIIQCPMLSIGISENFDKFFMNNTVHDWEVSVMSSNVNLDMIAVVVMFIFMAINIVGIKSVSYINIAVAAVSVTSLVTFTVVALAKGSIENMYKVVDPVSGRTGFMPFGISGVFSGAGTSFFAFVGLESVVCLAEEAIDPKRDIPRATIISFVSVLLLYVMTGFSIAYFTPWYSLTGTTGLISSLKDAGLVVPQFILTAGLLFTVFSCGLCTLTTTSRIVYSVSDDGLLWQFLSKINNRTQVPIWNIVLCTVLGIIAIVIYPFETLLHMVSGGTLMVFVVTALAILILSYDVSGTMPSPDRQNEETPLNSTATNMKLKLIIYILIFVICAVLFSCLVAFLSFSVGLIVSEVFLAIGMIVALIFIKLKIPRNSNEQELNFVCPGKPFVPGLCVLINLFLFFHLEVRALVQLVIYSVIGLVIYFTYGVFHSKVTVEKQKVYNDLSLDSVPMRTSETDTESDEYMFQGKFKSF